MSAILILLIDIGVVLLLSRLLGLLMRLINQPQVVGEMIAGIMLGPSLLGLVHHGAWMNALFPQATLGNLNVLSQLGVMLFMFLVGLELDPKLLHGQGSAALVTGTFGILIPFLSGGALGLVLIHLCQDITGEVASPMVLCLFMGAAMSITAFPVLARILTELNLHKTRTGVLALTCAAMDDVMGWCILAFVLAIAQMKGFGAEAHHGSAVRTAMMTVGCALAFVLAMIFLVRPLLKRLEDVFETRGYLSQSVLAIVFMLLIGSAIATDLIGIHQIFGAFMFGAVMPKGGAFIKHLTDKVEDFTVLFLLPLFFAYTGLRTELGLLGTTHLWLICGVIVLTAVAGKFCGVTAAARFCGISWRQSSLLGVLMNTRGLMELIILNIGLTFGVLSKPLFAMMVVMALTTTFMTTPLMRLLYSPRRQKRELDEAARAEAAKVTGMHVVVPVSLTVTAPALVRVGRLLMGGEPGRIYALHLDRPSEFDQRGESRIGDAEAVLEIARKTANELDVKVNSTSFVSRNIGRDIAESAERYQASWIVLGWHKPGFFRSFLGGVIGRVLQQAPANIAIFCEKRPGTIRRVMVPYLGGPHDRHALLAAERISAMSGIEVTLTRIIGTSSAQVSDGSDPTIRPPVAAGIVVQEIESADPEAAILERSDHFDLLVLGLPDEGDAKLLTAWHEKLASQAQCSVLLVHSDPRAPIVQKQSLAVDAA
jgi:Kef-type K+ transport system membrane component KefB/nucleotide-binding universal stress UspA family protein